MIRNIILLLILSFSAFTIGYKISERNIPLEKLISHRGGIFIYNLPSTKDSILMIRDDKIPINEFIKNKNKKIVLTITFEENKK